MGAVRREVFNRSHLGVIAELAADPDVQRFTRFPVPAPPDFAEIWWGRLEAGRARNERESFAVIDETDDRVVGLAGAPKIDRDARTVELGYLIAPSDRGRRAATEALSWPPNGACQSSERSGSSCRSATKTTLHAKSRFAVATDSRESCGRSS